MNKTQGNNHEWSDDEVQTALRQHYSASTSDSYWATLERSIMERVKLDGPRTWWAHFPGWVQYGMAAAAAAAIMAGVASWQTRAAQDRIAYRRLLGDPVEIPVLSETLDERTELQRENTLRYLISY